MLAGLLVISYFIPPIACIIYSIIKDPKDRELKDAGILFVLFIIAVGTPIMIALGFQMLWNWIRSGKKTLIKEITRLEKSIEILSNENGRLKNEQREWMRKAKANAKISKDTIYQKECEINDLKEEIKRLKKDDPYEQIKREIGI